jgi:cold shock CspA family protein
MRFAGRLHTWNEQRGFGFIRPANGGQDIFVHVSSLPKPVPGPDETVTFAVAMNGEGKKKAVDVRLERVELAGLADDRARMARRPVRTEHVRSRRRQRNGIATLVGALLLIGIAAFAYRSAGPRIPSPLQSTGFNTSAPADVPAASSRFHCDGRTMCSQMTSCEEATYFVRNCPGTQMDGNHDGVPCERQWCH